jgi:hypothetical protein
MTPLTDTTIRSFAATGGGSCEPSTFQNPAETPRAFASAIVPTDRESAERPLEFSFVRRRRRHPHPTRLEARSPVLEGDHGRNLGLTIAHGVLTQPGTPTKPAKPGLDDPFPRLTQVGTPRRGVPDFSPSGFHRGVALGSASRERRRRCAALSGIRPPCRGAKHGRPCCRVLDPFAKPPPFLSRWTSLTCSMSFLEGLLLARFHQPPPQIPCRPCPSI